MKYTIENLSTGHKTRAKTFYNAQVLAARQLASDVEGQTVVISGGGQTVIAKNDGFFVKYTEVTA